VPSARDDQALELLRASSGLSIDEEGRFLHRGEPITHRRTLEVLWSSLARGPAGRWMVRIGRESAYVSVAETPWAVGVSVPGPEAREGAPPELSLPDGSREPLDPATLSLGADGVLRCRVKGGERARLTRAGQIALGLALEEDPPGSGLFYLTVGVRRWLIGP